MSKMSISLKRAFSEAENRAKARDDEKEIDLQVISAEDAKAEKLGYGIYKLRKVNAAPFVQSNVDNLQTLISIGYLTDPEWNITSKIQTLCELNTNAIINPQTKQIMNISEIAQFLRRDRAAVSKIITELLKKRILYEVANIQEIREHQRPVSERPLFINPELYYAGNRNQINAILCKLCLRSDIFEKNGIRLPWKVWYESGNRFGKLVTRHTYLSNVKRIKEAKISPRRK